MLQSSRLLLIGNIFPKCDSRASSAVLFIHSYQYCWSVLQSTATFVEKEFDGNVIPALMDFLRIPNLSPAFDPEWETNGTLLKAATHLKSWVEKQELVGASVEIVSEPGKPPLLFIEVAATDTSNKTVLFYGHYDKQPHFTGWMEGTGPTNPVIIDGYLYGRGSSDDGYSLFSSILSIKTCQKLGYGHPKCIVTIEGEEETDSGYYMAYLDALRKRIGTPDFVFCLDSGGSSFETMWLTNSLRGIIEADLTVSVLNEGVHSGDASGIVPSAFRILCQLLARLENADSGVVNDLFQVNIPPSRYSEACRMTQFMGEGVINQYPFFKTTNPTTKDPLQAYLNRTWRSQLSVVGADGLPETAKAGNVLLPSNTLRLSLRIPPTLDAEKAAKDLVDLLESNPPNGAKVTCKVVGAADGWNAPALDDILSFSVQSAAQNFFGQAIQAQAEGGSIPLMNDLQLKWPSLQFLVTGALGPFSNAHGPNERLHISYTKQITCCIAQILADTSFNRSAGMDKPIIE